MQINIKRRNRPMIKIKDATPYEIGAYLHQAAEANRAGDLELFMVLNDIKDPIMEVKI